MRGSHFCKNYRLHNLTFLLLAEKNLAEVLQFVEELRCPLFKINFVARILQPELFRRTREFCCKL
jgi:hypothetical protein